MLRTTLTATPATRSASSAISHLSRSSPRFSTSSPSFSSPRPLPASVTPPSDSTTSPTPPATPPSPAKRSQPAWVRPPGPPPDLDPSKSGWKQRQQAWREPPNVERARAKTVAQRNVFESYLVLPWRTRLFFWLGVTAVSVVGLYAGDYFVPETEEEKVLGSAGAVEKELIAASEAEAGTGGKKG